MPTPAEKPEILLAILTDLSIDHRCYKLAQSLKKLGAQPIIYCDLPLHPLGDAWKEFEVHVLTRKSHLQAFLPVFMVYLLRLLPILLRSRANIWISLDAPPLFWLALWGKIRGRTVVYDSHELFTETPLVQARLSRRLFWQMWEWGGFALIRKAITVSPAIVEKLRAQNPQVEFFLLPNMPVKTVWGETPEKPRAGEIRLVFQGGMRLATGLSELFTALESRPHFQIDLYGAGPEEENLKRAARHSGLGERARFHGSVPFEALPALLAKAHIGIHLMQPVCGSFALTWANKVFDYTQALLPSLLSENPAHQILLQEFAVGVAVDSFSPEAIGKGLDALALRFDDYKGNCAQARERWHWDAQAQGLGKFLSV